MLRMTPCVSAEATRKYFREALSRGDYYTQQIGLDQEIIGRWGGNAAATLGLEGTVKRGAFDRLCDNLRPDTGERLTARTKTNRRVAYDFNFHVPKSVSVMLELGDDHRIEEAFRDAVSETMRELERGMKTRVRRGGADTDRLTGNMVWAEFTHYTSRPVDGVPDLHCHQHVVIFNATWDPVERRWKAGEFGDLKRDATYYQAAYHARLAEKLTRLGYDIERRDGGWEIAGIDASIVDAFSRRRDQIEKLARERGITDPDRKAELGAESRERKRDDLSMESLRSSWRERLSDEQRDAIAATRENASRDRSHELDQRAELDRVIDWACEHVFEHNSIIPMPRLLAAALEFGVGRVTPESLRNHLEHRVQDGNVLRRQLDGQTWVTTPTVLEEEQSMLRTVREGRGQHAPLKAEHSIDDAALSAEQQDAVKHVLDSTDSVVIVRGRAGVGKTRLMREVVAAIESTGRVVQAAAPTGMATHEVLRGDGFANANAQTVAHLLKNEQLQHDLRGHVLWVDEAGLVSVPDMRRLVTLAERNNIRLLLTGDTRQHRSILRGDALRLLETESGITPAEVTQVRRQRTPEYKRAAELLARGDLAEGFETLDRMEAIQEVAEHERGEAIADAYLESIRAGRSTLVVSPTHVEGRMVTDAIRERLKAEAVLGRDETSVDQLRNRHLTEAERSDVASYRVGDIVQFHQNAKGGHRKSDRAEVLSVDGDRVTIKRDRDGATKTLPLEAANRFAVYERGSLSLTPGDFIRMTREGRTANGRHRLSNGAIYRVDAIDEKGNVTLNNGWKLDRGFGHLAHGYCVTSDASQGRTVDHLILAQSSESVGASSMQQFYTSATRGRHCITIVTDDKERLLRAAGRDASRMSATELIRPPVEPVRERGLRHRRSIGLWLSNLRDRAMRHRSARLMRERTRARDRSIERGGFERER